MPHVKLKLDTTWKKIPYVFWNFCELTFYNYLPERSKHMVSIQNGTVVCLKDTVADWASWICVFFFFKFTQPIIEINAA